MWPRVCGINHTLHPTLYQCKRQPRALCEHCNVQLPHFVPWALGPPSTIKGKRSRLWVQQSVHKTCAVSDIWFSNHKNNWFAFCQKGPISCIFIHGASNWPGADESSVRDGLPVCSRGQKWITKWEGCSDKKWRALLNPANFTWGARSIPKQV